MNSCFWKNLVNTEEGFFVCPRNKRNFGNRNSITGYYTITLKNNDGDFETLLMSRAIWMAANRQRIPKHLQICHLNDDPSVNKISNLFCDSARNNVLQSIKNRKPTRKRNGHKTKVQAIYPNGNKKTFKSLTACANELNVSRPVIGKILSLDPVNKYYHYAHDNEKNKYTFVRIK